MKQGFLLELSGLLAILTAALCAGFPDVFAEISVNVNQGDRVDVRSHLAESINDNQPFVFILQVKDSSGATVFLTWENGMLGDRASEISWHPNQKGSYKLQSFLWTGFDRPAPIMNIVDTTEITLNNKNITKCMGDAQCFNAKVTKVIDGDTLRVDRDITIRFSLVNTPESGEQGYTEATDFTSEMCPVGSEVLVDEDDGQTEGSYGRMIAKLSCSDGKIINEELLEAGHAAIYTNFCDESEFALEEWAQEFGCRDVLEPNPEETIDEQPFQLSIGELKQFALQLINEDREKQGLSPVLLSNNFAAQTHADDLFKTRYHSTHWTSDGMKPYMKYTIYGGEGAVAQNVHAGPIYSDDQIERCKADKAICQKVDMKKQIEESEYLMLYEDEECCDNGHRDNILDKYHTKVSIGIAYDDYYFAFVQNFENIYIEYDDPIEENRGYIEISGDIISGKLLGIEVFYDETPTIDVYNEFKDQNSYSYGDLVAHVVEPARVGYYYEQPDDYTLIEATRWKTEGNSFDLAFNLYQLMSDSDGVYTIVILLEDENYDVFEATSHSFFE